MTEEETLVEKAQKDPGAFTVRIMSWPQMGGGLSGRAVEPHDKWVERAVKIAMGYDDEAVD